MKRLVISICLVLFILINFTFSQDNNDKVNNPNVIKQFIEKSPLLYDINEMKDTILPIDRSKNLVENIFYSLRDGEDVLVIQYEDILFTDNLLKSGNEQYNEEKYSEALNSYKKLSEKYPDFIYAKTLQAKCLIKLNQDDDALDLLQEAIDENYIDYEAQALIGELYDKMGLTDVAIRYFTTAHILNRNDTIINNLRKEIFKKKGLKTTDWAFTPQLELESSKNTIYIYTKEQYQFYALASALWEYDSDYRATKTDPDKKINLNRLQETILCHSMTLQAVPWYSNLEEGKCFQSAFNKMMINEFIYYEIILPQYPEEASKLNDDQLNKLVNYVIEIRGEKE